MNKEKILVVDDEEALRDILQFSLSDEGYEVVTAPNGEEAMERIDENNIDLVILDIKMPGIDGIEVLRRIKKGVNSDIGVIMMTAYGSPQTETEVKGLGAYDYVLKPFDRSSMKAKVREYLDQDKSPKEKKEDNEHA